MILSSKYGLLCHNRTIFYIFINCTIFADVMPHFSEQDYTVIHPVGPKVVMSKKFFIATQTFTIYMLILQYL